MKCACAILSSVACPALQNFPNCLINGFTFDKKVFEKMHILIFSKILFETFLILRINQLDMIKNVYRSSCKVPVILVRF
jgi:hypothetical protein